MNVDFADQASTWGRACAKPAFAALKSERARLVCVLLAVYLVGYLGLAVLCGFFREFMGIRVLGPLNLGYSLIIGNYVLAWILALVYLRRSGNRYDILAATAIKEHTATLPAATAVAP